MFDANGTEGLELFTWIVGGLLGIIAALTFTHFLSVQEEDKEAGEETVEVDPVADKTETH